MKFTTDRPYGDPEKAARKLVEIANAVEPAQDSRIFIELINWPFLHDLKGDPAEYKAGLELAIEPPRDCRRLFCLSHAATAVSAIMA